MQEITRFENISLGISTRLAKSMDPVSRLLTTSVVEAIFDTRLNPSEIHNKIISVFASLSYQDLDKIILYEKYEVKLLSPDEINRSFDKKASGFSRSDSVGEFFLQIAKNVMRIYAEFNAINVEQGEHILDKNMMFNTAEF
ncbi:hypothetical protein M0802_015755 [Mischocyttarus mexicanus]|nr:hypothetical protein M0802_015755 [Mischocyttarus mexicanus]